MRDHDGAALAPGDDDWQAPGAASKGRNGFAFGLEGVSWRAFWKEMKAWGSGMRRMGGVGRRGLLVGERKEKEKEKKRGGRQIKDSL